MKKNRTDNLKFQKKLVSNRNVDQWCEPISLWPGFFASIRLNSCKYFDSVIFLVHCRIIPYYWSFGYLSFEYASIFSFFVLLYFTLLYIFSLLLLLFFPNRFSIFFPNRFSIFYKSPSATKLLVTVSAGRKCLAISLDMTVGSKSFFPKLSLIFCNMYKRKPISLVLS